MKNLSFIKWKTLGAFFLINSIGLNIYFYNQNENLKEDVSEKKHIRVLNQKRLKKIEEFKAISHRLSLPSNRLSLGEDLRKVAQDLKIKEMGFNVSPEEPLDGYPTYALSKVTLKIQNMSDAPLYALATHIMKTSPGMIIPLELHLAKEDNSHIIHGFFRYEWVKKVK